MGIFDIFKRKTNKENMNTKTFNEETLKEENQIKYIQEELGVTMFTEEDSKGKNGIWYANTRQYLKSLTTEELKKMQDKLWNNHLYNGDDGKFYDLTSLLWDELEDRGVEEEKYTL